MRSQAQHTAARMLYSNTTLKLLWKLDEILAPYLGFKSVLNL